jgi:hypothetical protein
MPERYCSPRGEPRDSTLRSERPSNCIARQSPGQSSEDAARPGDGFNRQVVGDGVKIRKRTEIIIETDRLVVVTGRKASIVSWCRECNQRVKMVTVDEAAAMGGLSSRTVYRWIEAEKIHSIETSEKFLLVCPRSLMSAHGMEETGID